MKSWIFVKFRKKFILNNSNPILFYTWRKVIERSEPCAKENLIKKVLSLKIHCLSTFFQSPLSTILSNNLIYHKIRFIQWLNSLTFPNSSYLWYGSRDVQNGEAARPIPRIKFVEAVTGKSSFFLSISFPCVWSVPFCCTRGRVSDRHPSRQLLLR